MAFVVYYAQKWKRKARLSLGAEKQDAESRHHDPPAEDEVSLNPEEEHKNHYVCLACREEMANEIWVTCDHPVCYCSHCAANMDACPICTSRRS